MDNDTTERMQADERRSRLVFHHEIENIGRIIKREKRWYTALWLFIVAINLLGIVFTDGEIVTYVINILLFTLVFFWQYMYLSVKRNFLFLQALNVMAVRFLDSINKELKMATNKDSKSKKKEKK